MEISQLAGGHGQLVFHIKRGRHSAGSPILATSAGLSGDSTRYRDFSSRLAMPLTPVQKQQQRDCRPNARQAVRQEQSSDYLFATFSVEHSQDVFRNTGNEGRRSSYQGPFEMCRRPTAQSGAMLPRTPFRARCTSRCGTPCASRWSSTARVLSSPCSGRQCGHRFCPLLPAGDENLDPPVGASRSVVIWPALRDRLLLDDRLG